MVPVSGLLLRVVKEKEKKEGTTVQVVI